MGAVWLHDMPKWLRDGGLNVRTWPGWETRSRASGGYDAVRALGLHHTASPPTWTTDRNCQYNWNQAESRPVGAVYLARDGEVVVGAAGATNTQGLGGPVKTSKGVIPQDQGNRYMLSIEAGNNGVGEVWPEPQLDAYVQMCSVLCGYLDLDPLTDIFAHFEWAPGRKIDPAGPPTPYMRVGDGSKRWNMNQFRADVNGVNLMPIADKIDFDYPPKRLIDTRQLGGRTNGDQVITLTVPDKGNAVGAIVNITVTDTLDPGFVQVYLGGSFPETSDVNFWPNGLYALSNSVITPIDGSGNFNVRVRGRTHIIVDVKYVVRP